MIHHVFACKSNIGDWLSAKAIQSLVKPELITEYLCDDPFVPGTLRRLTQVTPEDLIVIGGGGLFMDYFMPFWQGFAGMADRLRFGIWGAGYCDEKQKSSLPSNPLLGEIAAKSAFCSVRDTLTIDYLQLERASPVPCPSMALIHLPAAAGCGLLHVIHYDLVGAEAYEFAHVHAGAYAHKTGRPYRQIDNQIEDGSDAALDRVLAAYAAADLVVTSRLHGCIIGLAMGKKVLAVSGDHKIDAFMKLAGLEDWVCLPEDRDRFVERLHCLHEQVFPADFVTRARSENLKLAGVVKGLVHAPAREALA